MYRSIQNNCRQTYFRLQIQNCAARRSNCHCRNRSVRMSAEISYYRYRFSLQFLFWVLFCATFWANYPGPLLVIFIDFSLEEEKSVSPEFRFKPLLPVLLSDSQTKEQTHVINLQNSVIAEKNRLKGVQPPYLRRLGSSTSLHCIYRFRLVSTTIRARQKKGRTFSQIFADFR